MRIDKNKLSCMAVIKDDDLWRQIKSIASLYGISLPDKTPPGEELARVRAAFNGDKLNLNEAINAIKAYKGRNGNGNEC